MKKPIASIFKVRNLSLLFAAAPIGLFAVAVSCSKSSSEESNKTEAPTQPVNLTLLDADLANTRLSLSNGRFTIAIPKNLTHVNSTNKLSLVGTKEAVRAFGKLAITVNNNPVVINSSVMPVVVLNAYLNGELKIENSKLIIYPKIGSPVDVEAVYGEKFNFTLAHLSEMTSLRTSLNKWNVTIDLSFQSMPGFSLANSSMTRQLTLVQVLPPRPLSLDLSLVAVRAAGNRLVIDESLANIPSDVALEYKFGASNSWISSDNLEIAARLSVGVVPTIRVRAKSLTSTPLANDFEASVNTDRFVGVISAKAFLDSVTLNADLAASVPSALVWQDAFLLPDSLKAAVSSAQFLLGNFATPSLAQNATSWQNALPSTVNAQSDQLWINLLPHDNYLINDALANVTARTNLASLSGFANSLVTLNASAAELAKAAITISEGRISFTIPRSITHLNASGILANDGTKEVITIDGAATIKVGGVAAAINHSKMPLEVLNAYLNGALSLVNGTLTMGSGSAATNVSAKYQSNFDFTPDHLAVMQSLRAQVSAWELSVNLSLSPLSGYALSNPALTRIVVAQPTSAPLILDLTQVRLTALNNRFALDESALSLPSDLTLEYQVEAANTKYTAAELVTYLNSQVSSGVLPSIYVAAVSRLGLPLINNFRASISMQGVVLIDTTTFLNNIRLTADLNASTPSNLVWNSALSLPDSLVNAVSRVEYLIGNYSSSSSALAASNWSSALPLAKAVSDNALWVRLVPHNGYILTPAIFNIYAQTNLANVTSIIDVSSLLSSLQALAISSASTHNSLTWMSALNIPASLQGAVTTIEFASGNYTTLANVPSAAWQRSLPTSAPFNTSERHIYARLIAASGVRLSAYSRDLTSSSGVQSVKTQLDAHSALSNVDLSVILLTGPIASVTLDDSRLNTLPSEVNLRFNLNGIVYTGAELVSYLRTNAATLSAGVFANLQAFLTVSDETKYVLQNNHAASINTSAVTFPVVVKAVNVTESILKAARLDGDSKSLVVVAPQAIEGVSYEYKLKLNTRTKALMQPINVTNREWYSLSEINDVLRQNAVNDDVYDHELERWKMHEVVIRPRALPGYNLSSQSATEVAFWTEVENYTLIKNSPNQFGDRYEWLLVEMGGAKLREYDNPLDPNRFFFARRFTNDPNEVTALKILRNQINSRLFFGPEAMDLKNININAHDNNNVLIPGSFFSYFDIFISSNARGGNFQSVWKDGSANYGLADNVRLDDFKNFMVEGFFSTFFHEYFHSLTFSYLTANFYDREKDNVFFPAYNPTTRNNAWNKEFVEGFRSALNFNDTSLTNYPAIRDYGGNEMLAITNYLSPAQLFFADDYDLQQPGGQSKLSYLDFLNDRTKSYSFHNGTATLSSYSASPAALSPEVKSSISYYFDLSELIVRFLEQALLLQTSYEPITNDRGALIAPWEGRETPTTPVFMYDLEHYAIAPKTPAFTKFYVFDYDSRGNLVDNTPAKKLQKLLLDIMGYNAGYEISYFNFDFGAKFLARSTGSGYEPVATRPTQRTDLVRFGGYLYDSSYKYIGYYDDNSQFVALPINVQPVHFFLKDGVVDRTPAPRDITKPGFFYQLIDEVNIKLIKDRPLYFSVDERGVSKKAVQSFRLNASTDRNERTGSSVRRTNEIQTHTVYAESVNGFVVLKERESSLIPDEDYFFKI